MLSPSPPKTHMITNITRWEGYKLHLFNNVLESTQCKWKMIIFLSVGSVTTSLDGPMVVANSTNAKHLN